MNLAMPMAWQLPGALLLTGIMAAAAMLVMGSYSRVQLAGGVVTLSKGVASIVPSRAGIVTTVFVTEGEQVHKGAPLASVRAEEHLLGGETASDRISGAISVQDARLRSQIDFDLAAAHADEARLREHVAGVRDELASLAEQESYQVQMIKTAEGDYKRAAEVAERGYISRRDIDTRQATVISRRQQLSQIRQSSAAKQAELAESKRTIQQLEASVKSRSASAQSNRAALATELARTDLTRGFVLTAPVSGTITALTAQMGQPLTPQQQIMLIIPSGSRLTAELALPPSAAGFIAPGQEVRLAVDAFPFQTFGTMAGRVRDVSKATVVRAGEAEQHPTYLARVDIPRPYFFAFGRRRPLMAGMTLTARVVTERRSLFRWLFEPMFAVANR